MAKRRGRPRKKQVTYDSRETQFFLAVLLFIFGVLALISFALNEEGTLFSYIRATLGEATILLGMFFINWSFHLFGFDFVLTSKKSLISQALLTIFTAILLMGSSDPNPVIAKEQAYGGGYGGVIGYSIYDFSQQHVLLNLTSPVFFVFWVLMLPSMFNQNIAEFFSRIAKAISKGFNYLFPPKTEADAMPPLETNEANRRAMVGDFALGKKFLGKKEQTIPEKPEVDSTNVKDIPEFVGINQQVRKPVIDVDGPETNTALAAESTGTMLEELKFPNWQLPPTTLLNPVPDLQIPKEDVKNNSTIIEQTLASFGIESKVMDVSVGPSVTQYALDIALGIKVSKISNLRNDLALALATSANAVRIEVPIPGTSYVGIEVPNSKRRPVFFRELIEGKEMKNTDMLLPVSVGKGIAGNDVVADIQKMPHLLIAGATGSGKSVLTVSFITSLLMRRSPDEVRFILVDPKQVELSDYNNIPHLLTPVITDMDKVVNALKWAVSEMERRYTLFREAAVRNLEAYNKQRGFSALPYIVIVIDEMADMMLSTGRAEMETNIVRLAQKARATGIHLILATQRPSVNVITGLIKANIPGRIGMSVTTGIDSRVILDVIGAESLLGKGDMLFKEPDKNKPSRVQGVLITQEEVQRVVKFIRDQAGESNILYIDDVVASRDEETVANLNGAFSGDDLFADSVRIIVAAQKGSSSLLQRKLAIGYNRAAKLLDELEEMGVVGPANGSKPREVLITDAEGFLAQLNG